MGRSTHVQRFRNLVFGGGRLTYCNFVDVFAAAYSDDTLFTLDRDLAFTAFGPREISYRDQQRMVARLANVLHDLGVSPGDRVGIMALNRVEALFANFAVARLGGVPVPMNFMLRPAEVEYVLENSGARMLICHRTILRQNLGGDGSAVPAAKLLAVLDADEGEAPEGAVALPRLVRDASESHRPYDRRDRDDVATIFYTSGTTGRPKGAALSDRAVTVSLRRMGRVASLAPRMRKQSSLLVMPVAHSGGYQNMLMDMALGVRMRFVSRFDPRQLLDIIETERPTLFVGTPAMYRMLEEAGAAQRDLRSVMSWAGGSDAFDDDLVRRFRGYGRFGHAMFVRGYGMTEANSYVAMSPPWVVKAPRPGESCVGWVLPGVHHRIVDPETLPENPKDVRKGDVGELVLRGVSLMARYWEDPERTEASFTFSLKPKKADVRKLMSSE